MALTFGVTGMDPATETSLKAAFTEANKRLGGAWQLLPETQGDHIVVDMDSMYGPMSWLRLHAAGKTVIGLTSAPRTQADFRLGQPFDAASVAQLLAELAPDVAAATPAGLTPAPQPQDQLPEEQPQPVAEAPAASRTEELDEPREPASAAVARVVPAAPTLQPHVPAAVEPEPSKLADWLASGRIAGKVRLERDGTAVLIDTDARRYHGPSALKPLTAHVSDDLDAGDFSSPGDWDAQAAKAGEAQPLTRLLWLGGLLAGQGTLMPGFDPHARYQMLKWPQTEREYPKHFRIATVMMKGPATLAEIAEASGVPAADVTDFVNASLATGFADVERPPEPEPEAPKAGLFGRLRGR
ncbi:hypothetical protein N799_06005 [Lysobacter arseniciresistens ZS79]|uniref:Uncharacterized protein n=1 Tax=Lysobacter arseniciresistens ZS79 TaxID=913325 RepID=A0A0A0F5F2_9GAMM|nr:hypothetical protein [Lysobacter arseniciresistens]KGM57603.1 hypothetical protein N799_06005 [Lysobacter arseniciresistens ZS79]